MTDLTSVRPCRHGPVAPGIWHRGRDGSGQVLVALDGPGCEVQVSLGHCWRAAVGPALLGAAVTAAVTAAVATRLSAWTAELTATARRSGGRGTAPRPDRTARHPEALAPVPGGALDAQLAALTGASGRLATFRAELAHLRAATVLVGRPGDPVVAAVRGGRLVVLRLEPAWRTRACEAELERHLGDTVRAALAVIAEQPVRVLAGCPELAAFLADSPVPLPFPLP